MKVTLNNIKKSRCKVAVMGDFELLLLTENCALCQTPSSYHLATQLNNTHILKSSSMILTKNILGKASKKRIGKIEENFLKKGGGPGFLNFM